MTMIEFLVGAGIGVLLCIPLGYVMNKSFNMFLKSIGIITCELCGAWNKTSEEYCKQCVWELGKAV